jgi:hypothetical protein
MDRERVCVCRATALESHRVTLGSRDKVFHSAAAPAVSMVMAHLSLPLTAMLIDSGS